MIPFVDQICDVRDVVANCKKINEDTSNSWAWVGLVLTLIGLFPTFGSLANGCLKILFAYGRKTVFRTAKATMDSGFWNASRPFVEAGIHKLNQHLRHPAVRRALWAVRWANPYRELAKLVRETAGGLNVAKITAEFDKIIRALRELTGLVKKWGTDNMGQQADALVQMVTNVRRAADAPLRRTLGPVTDWLNKLARRLEVESDMAYRANTNSVNPHHYRQVSNDAEEMRMLGSNAPSWVDAGARLRYRPLSTAPSKPGWPDISSSAPRPLNNGFNTFHSARAVTIPEGEVLYRVVDPASVDNSICWMRKSEFEKLKNKDDWRRHFAVKANWNANGEFVTYTVPRGGLQVWEGPAASQAYKDATGAARYVLEGGYSQIVLDPAHLDVTQLGQRQLTGWGYSSPSSVSMIGVPTLKNNWYGK
ncbi:hypothetical protein WCE37_03710 [Luteimonas sp. MJ250]|uniref:hypothetical protein n=1 Tax=Luteimonas sp. MJ250 TaxID=3129236 RepID=UPI0031BBC320